MASTLRSTAQDEVDYRYRQMVPGTGSGPRKRSLPLEHRGWCRIRDVPVEDDVALLRAAMIVGLGIEYNLSGKTALLLGATFNNGLFNVASNKNFGPDFDGRAPSDGC